MNEEQTTNQEDSAGQSAAPNVEPPRPPTEQPTPSEPQQSGGDDISQYKAMAIVGYILPFLFFVPLLSEAKDNRYAKFHANQQLNLLLLWVVGYVAAAVLTVIVIGVLLYPIVMVVGVVLMIIGIVNAANGETKPLPLIGKIELLK